MMGGAAQLSKIGGISRRAPLSAIELADGISLGWMRAFGPPTLLRARAKSMREPRPKRP